MTVPVPARSLRTLIICDRNRHAALLRAVPASTFLGVAEAICGAPPVQHGFAAPEWNELGDDGKLWVATIVREAFALAAERVL